MFLQPFDMKPLFSMIFINCPRQYSDIRVITKPCSSTCSMCWYKLGGALLQYSTVLTFIVCNPSDSNIISRLTELKRSIYCKVIPRFIPNFIPGSIPDSMVWIHSLPVHPVFTTIIPYSQKYWRRFNFTKNLCVARIHTRVRA